MAKATPFTAEQIHVLSQNPYTHSVTENRISFSYEFKKFFVDQTKVKGMTTKKILSAAGYNPDWFSKGCLDGMRCHILKEANSPEGLRPPRGLSSAEKTKQFAAKDLAKQNADQSIKELQDRIVHLEAQIEFLKKISHIRAQAEKNPKA